MSLMERDYMGKEIKELEIPLRDLEMELRGLGKSLRFKSNPFCRRKLEVIIKNYYGEKKDGRDRKSVE